jgi:hypothetical protein
MKASVSHFIYLPLHRSSQRKSSLERRSFALSRSEKGVRAILWKGIDFLFCFLLLGFHSCCVPLLAGRFLVCRCGRKDKNRRGRVQRKALVNNYPAIASYRIGSYRICRICCMYGLKAWSERYDLSCPSAVGGFVRSGTCSERGGSTNSRSGWPALSGSAEEGVFCCG